MSIVTRVVGENDNSDEFQAALRMKEVIDNTAPRTAIGEIILYPSATLFGQVVKDVDIMMIGSLQRTSVDVNFIHDNAYSRDQVNFESFCTTIEVKSHSVEGIMLEGTNWKVRYGAKWHNVTKQSNEQKISAKNYFEYHLGASPFITNLIWFTEITKGELSSLQTFSEHEIVSNALPGVFSFSDIMQLLVLQRTPWLHGSSYYYECGFNGNDPEMYRKPLDFFARSKQTMGELTRKKIEQITKKSLPLHIPDQSENKLVVLRGRAGTGKTIDLINMAIQLVEEQESRVQILTYNRALVSDIRRLFAFAEIPDMFEYKCVSINTMHSFFYRLINKTLYNGKLDGKLFIKDYEKLLTELVEFIDSGTDAHQLIHDICIEDMQLNWDYILIDEAQDWSEKEKNIILDLYGKNHIIVADGGMQFVRNIEPCDWTMVSRRENIKLKYCLRQKNNIVKFINHIINKLDDSQGKILTNDSMPGGHVIIIKDQMEIMNVIKTEKEKLLKAGNISYDMLFLTPNNLVDQSENTCFSLTKEFESKGVLLWDGTKNEIRSEYTVNPEEARVVQYDSARGLEGWTVCCLSFDDFIKNKKMIYNPKHETNQLLLESEEDQEKKYLLNWALIPLTRAIDTLVITLNNTESDVSKLLLDIADNNQDYVQVI